MIRENFGSNWYFRRGSDNPMTSFFVKKAEETEQVRLPHDAMLDSERSEHNSDEQGLGFFTPENVEYEKNYYVPAEDFGKVIYLDFEGVYGYAVLEINGQVACRHQNGFTGFTVDITDYLLYGQGNKIKVSVLNMGKNGRYYTGTGIYRPVSLMAGGVIHICPDGVKVTTLSVDSVVAGMDISVNLANEGLGHRKVKLCIELINAAGETAASMDTFANMMSREKVTVRRRLYVQKPVLWSIDKPYMYLYRVTVKDVDDPGEIIDMEEGGFGIRTISLDSVKGFCLNGQPVKFKGGCIHSDNGVAGVVSLPDFEERRIQKLKEAGYNAVRTSHNPVSRAFLDACDRNGVLVMEEFADAWTHCKPIYDYSVWMEDCWQEDIESMVRTAYNHPSVVMYSIGNEISDVGTDIGTRWGRKFIEKIRSLDSLRYITNGMNVMLANLDKMESVIAEEMAGISSEIADSSEEDINGDFSPSEINNLMDRFKPLMKKLISHPACLSAVSEACDQLDIVGYNYSPELYEPEHELHENRICLGSETNPGELDKNWEIVEKYPFVLGDFAWTAWDYIGEPGIARIDVDPDISTYNVYAKYPWLLAACGDFDITGFRRPMSYWRQIVWGGGNHVPYIAVQRPENIGKRLKPSQWSWTDSIHSWTFPGWEDSKTVVEVYTDGEEAELFLNGRTLGKKKNNIKDRKYYLSWDVVYEPGTLEVVAYKSGQEIGRSLLRTAGDSYMTVKSSRSSLQRNTDQVAFIEIEYRDKEGTLDTAADITLDIQVSENLELLGCGSANPRTEECYKEERHKLFEGRAVAAVRLKDFLQEAEGNEAWIKIFDDKGSREKVGIMIV